MACAALPVSGRVTSPFGWRWLNGRSDLHTGLDIGAPEGTPVYSMLPGVVVLSAAPGELEGYGNVIVVRHAPALFSLYAHLLGRLVDQGAIVNAGAELGAVGRTAGTRADPGKLFGASGAHLHLEFLDRWPPAGRDQNRIDPALVLGQLGVIVPHSGPLQLACNDTAPAPASPALYAEGAPLQPARSSSAPSSARSSSSSAAAAVLGIWLLSRYAGRHG